ncbi:MAG: DUF4932 domain-containing protein [Mucilaginibacter sp.]
MKKTILSLLLLIYICSFHLFAQTATPGKINVVVDERVELITTMQLLYEYPLVGRAEIQYKKEVQDAFGKHATDTSVKYFLNIAEQYFSFVKPINYTLHYDFPGFKQIAGFSSYENHNYEFDKHRDSLKLYITALRQFYKESNFDRFYQAHRAFYDSLIVKVREKVDSTDLVTLLEKYYGQRQRSYTLILSPLFIEAGMSTWIETPKGKDLYSIIGPNTDSKIKPDFDTRWLIQFLVMHEFSHPFCNPLIDKYYPQLEKDSILFAPIKKAMKKEGSATWRITLYELLTRANEIILDEAVFGKADADKVYQDYLGKQYIYLSGLRPIIAEYGQNRAKYETLDDIMPKVVAYFDGEAKKSGK